jgi:hypothetical protein
VENTGTLLDLGSPLFYPDTTFVITCHLIDFSLNLTIWSHPSLLNWRFQEDLVSCPGLESPFTFYNSLLLSWWEVCCVAFLEEPVPYPFGHLFSKMLPYLPYLEERPLYFIILVWDLLLSPLRCLLLRMPSCLI